MSRSPVDATASMVNPGKFNGNTLIAASSSFLPQFTALIFLLSTDFAEEPWEWGKLTSYLLAQIQCDLGKQQIINFRLKRIRGLISGMIPLQLYKFLDESAKRFSIGSCYIAAKVLRV